ncbi:MAG: T9SS C-terminal target domain-containing protein, partial [Bacteroidetes bacterium]
CGVLHTGPGVWFSYMGTGDKITFNTCASVLPVDTRISIYKGDCDKMFCTAGNDDAPYCTGGQSEVGFKTTAGTPYLIYVSTAGAAGADFTLKISCTGASQAGQLYPNPSSEEVFVDVEAGEETMLRWTLYNTQGQIVSGDEAPLTEGTNPVRVDVSELGEGIYTLQLRTESGELGFRRLQVKR